MGNPGYRPPSAFSACFKSYASTLADYSPEGMSEFISYAAAGDCLSARNFQLKYS
jgi:hypothetical protein